MFNDDEIKPNWHTGEKNIYKNVDGSYTIRKYVDGKRYTFARFQELSDAVSYRDYCISHEWDVKCKRKKSGRTIYISDMEMEEEVKII